eukprot:240393_1
MSSTNADDCGDIEMNDDHDDSDIEIINDDDSSSRDDSKVSFRMASLDSSDDSDYVPPGTKITMVDIPIHIRSKGNSICQFMVSVPWLRTVPASTIVNGYVTSRLLRLQRYSYVCSVLGKHALLCTCCSMKSWSPVRADIDPVSSFRNKQITDFDKEDICKGLTLSVDFDFKFHYQGPSQWNSTNLVKSDISILQGQQQIIKIAVNPNISNSNSYWPPFVIYALYSKNETFANIIQTATAYTQHKLYQKHKYLLDLQLKRAAWCGSGSSPCRKNKYSLLDKMNVPITTFDLRYFLFIALHINFEIEHQHKVKNVNITCEHMTKAKSDNPLTCPIYSAVKQEYAFNTANYHHVRDYIHHKNEFEEKPQCRYASQCKAYIRQQNVGDRIDDQCHMMIYRHPPRTRNIELARNVHSFIFNKSKTDNQPLYKPNKNDKKQYKPTKRDGYLKALIAEVKANQFAYDLCLECDDADDCKHSEYSILKIVDETLNHTRHKQILSPLRRDEMLALILYTGCDCNHDLCKQQRNGNYHKWKWFDFCLYKAITKLSGKERGEFVVYSGLNGVKMNRKSVRSGYFATYMSTAWQKEVAKEFMDGDGMIVAIDKKFKNDRAIKCCDVSWISKFPDECEVLFARSLEYKANNGFVCDVMDDTNGVQMICLKKKRKQ